MSGSFRRVLKWLLRGGIAVAAFLAVYLAVLAYPELWFSERARLGSLTFYSDVPFAADFEATMRDVERRLQAVPIYQAGVSQHVFVCGSPERFAFFARLSRVPPSVPGFNLSLFNNSFVSLSGLAERRRQNHGQTPHSALAGDVGQAIAHELMHDYMVADIGFFRNLRLPAWKTEGYVEYASTLAASRDDSTATLPARIGIWSNGISNARARDYYGWGLAVEYLSEVRGLSLEDFLDENVTLGAAQAEMLTWYRSLQPSTELLHAANDGVPGGPSQGRPLASLATDF